MTVNRARRTTRHALAGSASLLLIATPAMAQETAPIAAPAEIAAPQEAAPAAAGAEAPDAPAPAAEAAAAESGDSAFATEEVIVTARKKNETLLDVPVAVSAVSAADLNRYAATDLGKIGQMVPQVIIAKTGGGGAGASFTIRGLGSSALDAGIEQTVALNVDGLQISRGRLVTQSFFDIQQVEVLKGPQALFFGKNSPGGVISLRTAGATDEFSGYLRGGYEFEAGERIIEGAVSGPITDTLKYRFAGRASKMDGYIDNVAGPVTMPSDPDFPTAGAAHGEDPGTREYLGRLTVQWNPNDRLDSTLKVFGSNLHDNGETAGTELLCDEHPRTLDLLSGTYVVDPYGDCGLDGKRSLGALNPDRAAAYPGAKDGKPYTNYKSMLASNSANYKFDSFLLTSVTGYWNYKNGSFDNFGFDASTAVLGYNEDKSDSFTQELRLASNFETPVNFTTGLYFEHGSRDTTGNGFIAPVGLDSRNGQYNNWTLLTTNSNSAYSAFAQLSWKIVENVELAGGARYTHEDKKLSVGNSYVNDQFAPLQITAEEGVFTRGKFSDDNVSPEATLSYHPTKNSTFYAAYKTGYKSGGFSNPSILSFGQTSDVLGFKSEKAKGGEIGAKGEFLDRRLTITSAVYRYKFDGLQLTSFNPTPPSFTIRNAASARTTGAEIESSFAATHQLRLRAAAGYNKAEYLSFEGAPCYAGQDDASGCDSDTNTQDLSGTALVRAPEWNVTGGLTWDSELTDNIFLGLSSDANYTSGYWMQENEHPLAWQGGFTRINASARLYQGSDAWEVALIGRNLTNKHYGVASSDKPFGTPDEVWVSVGRTRELLLQGTYRF
ncbi:TonB-dependent receptor [Hydrocarboniphaga sp.]|uniref:TonB-dependent receptor n=1 Tax=Hydrocarboniphaga sp. TaxID=2033016 RepID=UPI003D0F3328